MEVTPGCDGFAMDLHKRMLHGVEVAAQFWRGHCKAIASLDMVCVETIVIAAIHQGLHETIDLNGGCLGQHAQRDRIEQ